MSVKYVFLSLQDSHYSRTGVYLTGVKSNQDATFFQIQGNLRQKISNLKKIKADCGQDKVYVVMSPSHQLMIYLRILGFKKKVLDAGWPLSDALFNRGDTKFKSLKAIKSRSIDFLAFHSANRVFFETRIQMERCITRFALPRSKCNWIFTGFNEIEYATVASRNDISKEVSNIKELAHQKTIVLYRGKYNLESGLDKLALASFDLGGEIQLVVATDKLPKNLDFSNNSIILQKRLTNTEISFLYRMSTLTVGLIGDLERLNWTIPHKLFEAAYFSRPVLCPMGEGILEFASPSNGILPLGNTSINSLSTQIKQLLIDKELLIQQGANLHLKYLEQATQSKLALRFRKLTQDM